jgi:MOSC domain-containing protein YiiM
MHRTLAELEAGVDRVRGAPIGSGTLELIVARPAMEERVVLDVADLDATVGLVGDMWSTRPARDTPDHSPHPGRQLMLMSARAIALFAGDDKSAWPIAGDQLYVDIDLSETHAPAGTRFAIGGAVIELTAERHTGCAKFNRRFGADALRFVNSPIGRELRLRGACAKVILGGTIRVGDAVKS